MDLNSKSSSSSGYYTSSSLAFQCIYYGDVVAIVDVCVDVADFDGVEI